MTIGYGSILKAKACHPIHDMGGDGIAFVTHADEAGFTFVWVSGDPATPGFAGDTGSVQHLDVWYEVVSENEAAILLPEGFVPPPDPLLDPAAALMAMFGSMDAKVLR
jgi:hypothetical protein